MIIRQAFIGFVAASLFTVSSIGDAAAAGSVPFKTLRAVSNPNGSLFLGGAGLTVTRLSAGHYRVVFIAGTWHTLIGSSPLTTPCFFIPQVRPLLTTQTAQITAYTTLADGSGSVDVGTSSGADAHLAMVFTSSNC